MQLLHQIISEIIHVFLFYLNNLEFVQLSFCKQPFYNKLSSPALFAPLCRQTMARHLVTTWHEAVFWLVVCTFCTSSPQLLRRFQSYAVKLPMPRPLAAYQLRLSANSEEQNRTKTLFTINWTQVFIKRPLRLQRLRTICIFLPLSTKIFKREPRNTRELEAGLVFPPCTSFRAANFSVRVLTRNDKALECRATFFRPARKETKLIKLKTGPGRIF